MVVPMCIPIAGVLTINSANYGRDHGTLTCEASNNNIVTVDRRTSTATTSINVLGMSH